MLTLLMAKMLGLEMNNRICAIFLITILLHDCIFVNLKYDAEYRFLYSLFQPKFYHTVFSQRIEQENKCALMDSCGTETAKFTHPRCYCDKACKEYNDCCLGANINDTSPRVNIQSKKKQLYACEMEAFRNSFYGILVVAECPEDYQITDVSEKCALKNNIHPVSADDGTTFRNVYCAYCHNVHKYNAWRFEYTSLGTCRDDVMELLTTFPNKIRHIIGRNCHYHFVPPSIAKFRSCLKNVISTDANTGLCSEFQNPVKIDNQLYRNVYCYNGSLSDKTLNCLLPLKVQFGYRQYGSLSLTEIFNIQPLFEIFGRPTCKENFYYDNKQDACIPNNCRENHEESCDAKLIRNYEWVFEMRFVTDDIIDDTFHLRLASFFYLSLPTERYQISMKHIKAHYKCQRSKTDAVKTCCVSYAFMVFSNGVEMSSEATKMFKSKSSKIKWSYIERNPQTNVSAFDVLENAKLTDACNVSGPGMLHKAFAQYGRKVRAVKQRIMINKTWTPPIDIPEYVEGVLVISGYNKSIPELRLEKWNVYFEADNETNQTRPTTIPSSMSTFTSDWSVSTILTYTTLGVSCFFLILTLTVYCHIGLFQSTSGIISKYMMASMLAAQLLFIVGVGANYVTSLCTVIGIISHYLWLLSFTWISIYLFSILKMMRTLYKSPGALTKGQKLSKVVYGFGFVLPIFIVLPCVLLDIFSEVDVGYSKGNICFPTGFLANLFSFTLPVLITLCFNIVTLVITSVSISRYNNTVLLLQSVRQVRSFIPVYLRLSMLCACPWILGIIADILQLDILRYIYITLAGSHGTFVGISFLLAKNVRDRVRCSRSTKSTNAIELQIK